MSKYKPRYFWIGKDDTCYSIFYEENKPYWSEVSKTFICAEADPISRIYHADFSFLFPRLKTAEGCLMKVEIKYPIDKSMVIKRIQFS